MDNRKFFFGVLIGTAIFVYLIGSFLIATFDITMWKDGDRFLIVVFYLILVSSALKALTEQSKPDKSRQKDLANSQQTE
ncbi:hypothetical protein GCM10023189_44840 [Nibrella saemangeumensis]|uniref:YiaAB two helix domain-containing protein n=1 Tax=Nibrella saemangeumensis TaxID=1084526 RepID=A0ABP8NFC5_9BACT